MIDQNLHTNAAWLKLSGLSLLIALSTICLGLSKTEGPSSVTPQCNNITHPGSIGYSATLCGGTVDPGTLVSVENASGGSGTLEYMWLKSTSGCPNDFSQIIPGANSTTYTPGSLSQTTWFRRCARRTNCSDWYETDCIKITVDPNCSLPPEGWSYTCEDGIEVEVVGEGIRCANSRTISIPNPGNVTQIVAEVVYKGSSPNPTQYTFTTNNQSIVAPVIMTSPARGYVFRALLNPANFVSINIPSQNRCNAQSMVLYIFRNTGNNAANSGKFVEAWLFQSSRCETLPIPVGPAPRDILITAPLSELTSDGRIARVTAVSGSASQTITVNDYNLGDALNITPFILPNVPASATSVNICVESPSGTVPSGQSLVFASALSVKPACKTCDDSDLSANINIISNYNGQAISCLGAADARIQVQSTGGLSPYTYAWSTGDNSATLTNLAAGTYRLTITDAFACTIERSITINDPDALQLDLNISSNYNGQDISCFGAADGEITATVNGGTPPYSYNWLNGQSTATVTGLTAGNYVLLVSDANGCTISDNISLQNPPQLTATIQIESDFNGQAISCPGESDAALRVLVNGGTAPYTYKWSDNSTNIRIDNLAPGNYAVTVKDANNCQTQANINITAPPTLDLGIDVLTDYNGAPVSCSDGADGSVRANPNGGTPPYTYNWSDGQNGQVATGLTVGNYGLTVADANGCTATSTTSLTAPEPLNCSASINTNYNEGVAISTFGGSDGAASASATGGVGPYVYQWNDAAFQTSREATNLSAGTYTVQVSDINGCTCTANISLSNPAKLGDQVFEDLNANGIQEAGEPSVANVAIQLSGTSNTGAPVNRAGSSDANGQYSFDGLPAGDYTISITTPQDFLITYQDEGADDAKDSDIDPNTSNSTPVALALGEYNQDLDIGLYQWAAIGDQVWIDENANGLQDNGEIGLADVEIQLEGTTGNGTPISLSLNSQSDGTYLFENLIPGNYQLIFSQPTTFQRAYLNEGGNEALDSDADPISGRTATEQLTSRERNLDYDAGYYKWASLGDRVWEDVNGNGLQDGGEPGLANVTVRLEGQTGNGTSVNRSILTANNGQYLFDELIPGAYQLIFESPNGFSTTYDKQGLDDTQDSDANPNTGQTATELLISGEDNTDYDAGYYQPVSIGDLVWEDVDGNGIQDSGEPGIANASVRLDGFTGNGTPISQSLNTGANGEYRFDDLFPGTYKLTFVSPNGFSPTYLNLGADDELDSDADPINGMTPATTLVSGDQEDRFDAGYYRAAAIGNLVWDDLNGNGIQDSGEPGLANVLITLIGTDGAGTNVTQSQSTLANGTYLFENLRPGEYKLTFSTQTGFLFTYNEEGNNEALDSDADPINGMSPFEILESGEINRDYDAGQYAPARIGDQTWLDCDKDGIFDSGEVPLAFVPISLEGTTGNGTPISLNTSSDNSGQYQFVNLRPGTYQLTFGFPNLPNGLAYAGQDQGGDDSIDSDVGIDGKTAFINLQSKAQNDKVDVGYMDVQAPLIDPIAADLIVECDGNGNTSALNDWLNSQGGAQAVDNISPVSGITWSHDYTTLSDDCGATGQAIVTFTATDECGNAAAVTAQFIIQDTRAPAFSNVPADLTVNCDEVPNAANVQIADICDANANLTYQEIREAGACEDSYLLRRIWTATDACGNVANTTQLVSVQDITSPILTGIPAAITVECDAIPNPAIPNASDNCDAQADISYAQIRIDGFCPDSYTLIRTWTASDNCGNQDIQSQSITVLDRTAPILAGVPADITVECDVVPAPANPSATDNCDADVTIQYVENQVDGDCEDSYFLVRTWLATDNCGNNTAQSQLITVQDQTSPSLLDVPADVTVTCENIPDIATPRATDNCDSQVDIVYNQTRMDGPCLDTYTLNRTWTATDNCGNQTIQTQVITVEDLTNPVLINIPTAITVECDAVPSPANPSATDNCDAQVEIAYSEVRTDGNCEDQYTLTRTWTANDNCGNQDIQSQVITVQDNTAPELLAIPVNLTVSCEAIPNPANPSATDNCDAQVDIAYNEIRTDGDCRDRYTLTRTWTATDNCGNQDIQSQVLTVIDDTAPELLGIPANITVECDAVPTAANPSATDNCDTQVDITYSEIRTDGNCADNYTLTRTWTATDNCGNQSTQSQVITVQDTQAPQLTGVPANITVECDALPNPAEPTASDNCDSDVTIDLVEERRDGNCEDNYILARTWTATDNCGNESVQTQMIWVQDTTDPSLAGIPADITLSCEAISAPAEPIASDNCDTQVDISYTEIRTDGACTDRYTLTRIWTATDNCGNQDIQSQVISVIDEINPQILNVPANITVECDGIPEAEDLLATDNCDDQVELSFTEFRTDGDCTDRYTLTRTWTATDNCGNQEVQSQMITVIDTTNPKLAGVPANITIACDAIPSPAEPTASDNCDIQVEISFLEIRTDGACADSYTLTRTWTATDNCGNQDVQSQIIQVLDDQAPELLGVPANITVECDAVPNAADPTASDNCDAQVEISYTEIRTDGNCTDNYILTRTWTATDNCGNQDVQSQIITVQDTTSPVLLGIPANTTVECDAVPSPANPSATDNCDAQVEISFSEIRTDGDCPNSYTLSRTWTATDNCGNQDIQSQIIIVRDETSPILANIPANITIECELVPAPAQPIASDNCDSQVEITFTEIRIDGDCADSYTLTRLWIATDNCGNQDQQTQIITVQDLSAPQITGVPANITVECDAIPAVAEPTASDNCDALVDIEYIEVRTDGDCEDSYTLTRTWTATDNCANQSSQSQEITVIDQSNPILANIPADITVTCEAIPTPAQPSAEDNCDEDVNIAFNEVRMDGSCTDSYTLLRVWTATDNCGNQDIQEQKITVQDIQAPLLADIPANITVECDAVPNPAEPMATDNCDAQVDIDLVEFRTDGNCADRYTLTRTWTATDNCGNQTVQSQIITVEDNTAPLLTGVPPNITVACDAVPNAAEPLATDNCDTNVDISYTEFRTDGPCSDSYTLSRTWTATDNCGNQSIQTQVIVVEDINNPILLAVPANITVECDNIPPTAEPTATDNCDTNVEITFTELRIAGACTDEYSLTRTWTATDNCGNQSIESQIITVQDNTSPELTGIPADITIACESIPVPTEPTATDNCDAQVEIAFDEIRTDGPCSDSYTLTRYWTATDNCGNQTVETQVITVQDSEAPGLAGVPADITVSCENIPNPTEPTTADNCDGDVTIDFVEFRTDGSCTDSYTLTRTWTATDNCGNQAMETQVITVQDLSTPILTGIPANITVECNAVPNAPVLNQDINATDNCDVDVAIDFTEFRTDIACTDRYTLVRTWTATDNCGNQDVQSQIITVIDEEAPILSGIPVDVTVECNAIPLSPVIGSVITATDNCDVDVDISFVETRTDGPCTDDYLLTRTWTAVDNCGNETSASQKIKVQDTTDPILVDVPANITVACDQVPAPAEPTATDNCDANVEIGFTEFRTDGDCEGTYTLTRTWTATDNCGNQSVQSQIIEVQDVLAPVFSGLPTDITVTCDQVPSVINPVASDDCEGDIDLAFTEMRIDGNCTDNYKLIRSWTATDACGNSISFSQNIQVEDQTAPLLSAVPVDITVACDQVPPAATPTASDNCDDQVDIELLEYREDGPCIDSYTLVRTWTASDNCANQAIETQVITVIDDRDPILTGIPADITVDCDGVPNAPQIGSDITASDNCDIQVEITFNEFTEDNNCAYDFTLIRSWTATDNCGNQSIESQRILVRDETAPILTGVPANISVSCGDVPTIPTGINATDNCDPQIDVQFSETRIDGNCTENYTLIRTWTATDVCGNAQSQSQTIEVSDQQAPLLTGVPANITVACDAVPTAPTVGTDILATDNCDSDVEISYTEFITLEDCTNAYTITRTWIATDNCGLQDRQTQLVKVIDTQAPSIQANIDDLSIECDVIPPLPQIGVDITASDNCDLNVTISFNEVATPGNCPGSMLLTRTWVATDNCGNTSSFVQQVNIGDGTAPVLVGIPADVTLSCGETPDPVNPTVEDNCDADLTIDFTEDILPGNCPDSYTLIRQWTVTDDCGNSSSQSQRVVVGDQQAPEIMGVPGDITVSCESVPAPANPTAMDDCDMDVEISFTELTTPGDCPYEFRLQRIWIAVDDCGHSTEEIQWVTVIDDKAPILLDVPADLVVDLSNGETVPESANVSAADNCDPFVNLVFEENIDSSASCAYTITRIWTATDACGLTTTASQQIAVSGGLAASISPQDASICLGESVQLSLSPSSSNASYSWSANGGAFNDPSASSPIFSANDPGLYEIEVLIKGACEVRLATTVLVSAAPQIQLSSNSPICEGDDIRLTASGGDRYAWTGPANFSSTQQNPIIPEATLANGGTYTVEVSNGNCTLEESITVIIGEEMIIDYNKIDVNCNELGSINIGVLGGTGVYTYDWADLPGSNDPEDRTDLNIGTYSVVVTDQSGCTVGIDQIIIANTCGCDAKAGGLMSDDLELCLENGLAVLSAMPNGDAVVPTGYTSIYLLSEGSDYRYLQHQSTPSFDVNEAGDYHIHTLVYDPTTLDPGDWVLGQTLLEDINSLLLQGGGSICAGLDFSGLDIQVIEIAVSIDFVQADKCQTGNGRIELSPANYNYNWSDGATGATRTGLTAGVYTVTVTDGAICSTDLSIEIVSSCICEVPAPISILTQDASCDHANGAIQINLAGDPSAYQYDWNPNTGTPNAIGNGRSDLTAGIYSVTISDPLIPDCSLIEEIVLGNSDGPQVNQILREPATCNASNGSIRFLPNSFEYRWVHDNGLGAIRDDLAAGIYKVVVIDPVDPDCPNLLSVEVERSDDLEVELLVDQMPQCGAANGRIRFDIGGSGTTYQFLWTDGYVSFEPSRENLKAGLYSLIIVDLINGCQFEKTFTLTDNTIGANIIAPDTLALDCPGNNSGQLDYSVSYFPGFALPATELMVDARGNNQINGQLATGTYCLLIYDNDDCLAAQHCFEVIAPERLDVKVAVHPLDCVEEGAIRLTVDGGSGSYTYDWADLPGSNDPQNRNDLEAGNYSLTVMDTNGCTLAVNDVLVEDLCPLGCTAEGGTIRNNSASVFCVDDGQMDMIEIEVNGNNGNYKYALTSANGRIERVSDDPAMDLEGTGGGLAMFYGVAYEGAIIGLESGEDINELEGCYSLSNSIVVNRLTGQNCLANCALPKVKDIVKFTATCGEANGQVRIEMAGDNAAYTYNWSPNIGTASGNIRSDLPSGGYSVSIADINDPNCFEVIRFALGNSDGPDPIALTTAAVCQQANGTAQLNPVAFTYQWEDNTMTNNRNDLAPGTYLVTATDNTQGCSTVLEVEVGSQNNLEATLTLNSPATCQQANGSATINVSGGTGNYSYSWAGGATRNDLTAGIYHVVISDNNAGCETTITFAVTEEVAGVDIDLPSTRLLTCAGDEDAFVSYTLTPQPGLAFPLREEIQNIAGTVVNNGSLGAGDYCVLVYDANDCLAGQACFEVIEPNPIVVDIFATPASCTALGAISLVATGGHSAFIYDWADIPGAFNQRDRSDLAAGTYALTITDGRNCEVVLPNLMVEDDCNTGCQVMAGMISSNSPNTFCVDDGQADLFEVLVSGNTGNYLFVITDTNAEILALSTNNQINFEGSGPGIVLVYGFAFDGPVDGLAVGETLAGLSGCFELTEPLAVTRLTGTDCQGTCIEPTVTNLIIVEASCNNADGQVTIELAGSPFQYDYIWAPNVSNTNEATGLVAGDYTVTITDPSVPNCFTITSFTVGNIDGPQANLFTVPATCLASNGAASFSPTNLTYTWADLFVGPERNDLAAGDYDVTISDGSSTCINVVMVSIDSNNPLSLAVQINALPGCQQANGSATILVSGGTNNYSYSWGAGPTQDNLAAGTYTVTVVDNGSGCEQSITFSLQDAVSEATITIPAQVSISCAGANDGEIDVQFTTNSNFPGPAVVEIVDANGILQNNGSLSPGNYCVIIRDANNCVAGQSCFEVIEPDAINLDIAIVDRECNSPGMIMLNVTGGTAPYTYDWQDLPGNADPEDRIDLAAGFYSVTVLDNQNCSVSSINLQLVDNCIINCTPPQIINIISQDATCNNTDGAIELDLVGDESDYVYTWSPNVSTSNSASNLSAGVYRLTITDINDPTCFSTENILINNLDGPVVDVVSSTPANCGQANGAASLSPNSFNYIWCNGATGSTVSGLPAGICYVTVTDPADGCTDVVEVLIDEIGLQASANILQQPDCGAANGLVTIQVNGGSNNYNYAWSDGGSGADRSDLSAGIYQVSITDNVNPACIFELIFTLTDQAVAAAFIDIISPGGNTSVSCAGTSDATIDFNLGFDVGFVQPASTEIVDGLGNVQVNGNLAPGNYCILVRDGQGCLAGEACFEVLSPDAISLDLVLADKTCTTAGQINLTTSGGTAPYQYNWADLAGNNNAEDRDDLEAGIYSVTVSDANACSLVADGLVIGSDCPNDCVLPVIANIVKINASCEEDNGSIFIALTDNSINYQYNWLPNVSSSNQASGLASGTYTVEIVDPNDADCKLTENIFIGNTDGPEADILSTTPATCQEANGTAVLSPVIYSYEWCDGATGFTRSNLPAGICFVTVTDPATNCSNVLAVHIDEFSPLTVSPIINAEPDCNQANGEVTISVTGGSTNYTYQWSDNGSGSPNRTDLAAGIYSVTVSDNGPTGCITTITFTLNNQLAAGAEVTINGLQAISCAGQTDGEVFFDVTPEPGFVLPFTASIVNEQGQLQVNGQLEAGSYCIVVQDANACFAGEACFELGVADALVLDIDISALTCTEDGRIEILATGGSGNYQYDWADLPGANDPRLRDDLVAGLYSITVSDQNGCTAIANDLEIIDDCGICPFASTEHLLVLINESETICAEIEDCFDPSTTTFELLDGGLMGSSIYGAYELGADGCLTFSANSLTGEAVDTICILADDGNLLDTTCIIISITDNPLINPGIDTIFLTTNEVTPVDTCLTTIALPNDFASTTIFYDPVNGTGTLTVSSLDSCVTYTPNPGQTGNFIDTMGVILCDVNDICDTFILVTSVIPDNCPDIVSIDTASIVSFDCSFGGTLCLDIDLMDVFDYDFSIDGQPYTSGFSPCDIDTVLRYELQPLLDVAPIGPYELSSWEFDGQTFSIDTFFTVETLVDSMNVWDTEGNWMIVGNTITGGITYDTYGELQIMQLLTQIDVRIDLNSIEVPNGSQIVVDSAAQLLLINELATGCVDSVFLNVECNDCPAIYDGPDIIMASDCEGMADLCLNLDIRNIQSYQIFDNQLPYSGLTTTCDFDTLLFYSYAGFSTPDMYTLDEWIVDGDTLTLDFMTIQELLDAMNDFDPDGDWSITGLIISGGDSMSDYGPLVISLNGTLITTSSPIPQLVPNGIAIQLDTGFHQIIVQDTLLGCIDTLLIDVICDDFTGGGIDTLLQIPEMSVDTFCIDISAFDTVTSIVNVCPNLSNGNVGFSALSEAGCFELIGEQIGLDTFCMEVCDELAGVCDTFNLIVEVTPVIDTLPVEVLIGFTDTLCINVASLQGDLDTIYNYCEAASGTAAEVLILETTQNCVELTGFEIGMDTACIVICDVEGFCDTTILVIEVIPPQIDTISETVLLGETDRYCIDTSELALTVDTIYNICENASGSFVDFSLEADSLCVFFEGLELGIDTACIVICDEGDFCDTTILIVEVLPQISAPPVAIDDDTTTILNTLVAIPVLANDSLNGSLVDIFIITDPLFGQVEINPDFTFTYVPDPNVCEVTDSFEYVIVTETGSDTATVSIFVMCDQLTIFSGFSPNDDGINDTFTILGIENFPNNRVYIFNRWGNEVYVQRGYTQANAWDGRWKGNDLPDGTYFYVIEDGEGNKFSGYVQLHR